MPETDLIWLSVLVFLPAACAVGLLAFPAKWPEARRWWALFGSAATLSVSLCVVVDYYRLLDSDTTTGVPRYGPTARLDTRADQAASDAARDIPKYESRDLV